MRYHNPDSFEGVRKCLTKKYIFNFGKNIVGIGRSNKEEKCGKAQNFLAFVLDFQLLCQYDIDIDGDYKRKFGVVGFLKRPFPLSHLRLAESSRPQTPNSKSHRSPITQRAITSLIPTSPQLLYTSLSHSAPLESLPWSLSCWSLQVRGG